MKGALWMALGSMNAGTLGYAVTQPGCSWFGATVMLVGALSCFSLVAEWIDERTKA